MRVYTINLDYIEKAKNLTYKEVEQVLIRMRRKLIRRAEDIKLSPIEAIAQQLEFEDKQHVESLVNTVEMTA
jgi:P pilus assembly chaperone PapD